ncbi:hypothetical protein [Jatrophihabitans sp.]|uniref:hypothetical protein n=1 Tax=Jatrophihabitans sp. TaxID=1932789 RepID=UPI0030C75DAC
MIAWATVATAVVGTTAVIPAALAAAPTVLDQHIAVNWSGAAHRTTTATATVPGIGSLQAICAPNDTMVQLTANNRDAETQMWAAVYEQKKGGWSVAVKTVRIYRYANADDSGKGGTGTKGNEGFNQSTPQEDSSTGYIHGVISQRPGRNETAATKVLAPVTSFELTWWWSGFRHGASAQSCHVDVHMVTNLKTPVGVDWHGSSDAAHGTSRSATISPIGTFALSCRNSAIGGQTLTVTPPKGKVAWLYTETITGEGPVDNQVDVSERGIDPKTGALGPVPLPQNGMLRLFITVGSVQYRYIVSSYYVTNNTKHPELNLCEVAASSW